MSTPTLADYVTAKHGAVGLTKTAAMEYAAHGIRVNAVGPAYIDTLLLKDFSPETKAGLVAMHPVGRLGRAEEVAELVIWLSSERASVVNEAYCQVDDTHFDK